MGEPPPPPPLHFASPEDILAAQIALPTAPELSSTGEKIKNEGAQKKKRREKKGSSSKQSSHECPSFYKAIHR